MLSTGERLLPPNGTLIPPSEVIPAVEFENPYGVPFLTFEPMDGSTDPIIEVQDIPGPTGEIIPTLHIGPGGGKIAVKIQNSPQTNPVKKIFWQFTSDKSPTPTGNPPTTNPPGTSLPSPYPQIQWGSTNWYTYNGLLEIRPNPEEETIIFELVESTNISEIVIDTVCEPVPEPSTLGLLAIGAIGLMMCVRRRRS